MWRKRVLGRGSVVAAVTMAGIAWAAGSASAATPFQDIGSAPLTTIAIGNELSCQTKHQVDSVFEFYPSTVTPGDCGTFVFVDGTLFAPDFASHGTTATSQLGPYTPFTPVAQTAPTGAGTAADPRRVVTTVNLGATGIQLVQVDAYVNGQEYYNTSITFNNTSGVQKNVVLYRAGDCYLQNSDSGYGFATNTNSVGCSANPNNSPPGRVEVWTPQTPGATYLEDTYSAVWGAIGTHTPFPNLCNKCTQNVDNGAGISWALAVAPGSGTSVEVSASGFSPTGQLPPGSSRRATSTSIRCDYIVANFRDTCTATVTDVGGSAPTTPTGSVSFVSDKGGVFPFGSTCPLHQGSTQGIALCTVEFIPPATVSPHVTSTYAGDLSHLPSSATSVSLIPQDVGLVLGNADIAPTAFFAAPSGPPTGASDTAALDSALASIARKFGANVSFKLKAPALVTFRVQRPADGRKGKGGRCVKPTAKNSGHKKCTRWVTLKGSFSIVGKTGTNKFKFRGRIGGKTLKPGKYRLGLTPSIAGRNGKPRYVKFRIKKP